MRAWPHLATIQRMLCDALCVNASNEMLSIIHLIGLYRLKPIEFKAHKSKICHSRTYIKINYLPYKYQLARSEHEIHWYRTLCATMYGQHILIMYKRIREQITCVLPMLNGLIKSAAGTHNGFNSPCLFSWCDAKASFVWLYFVCALVSGAHCHREKDVYV